MSYWLAFHFNILKHYFASSTIMIVICSTSLAFAINAVSFDNTKSICSGFIRPINVFPCSVITENRQGKAIFKYTSIANMTDGATSFYCRLSDSVFGLLGNDFRNAHIAKRLPLLLIDRRLAYRLSGLCP
jgi:hypothetical protein